MFANRMFAELNSYLRISLNSCRVKFLFEGDGEDAFKIRIFDHLLEERSLLLNFLLIKKIDPSYRIKKKMN